MDYLYRHFIDAQSVIDTDQVVSGHHVYFVNQILPEVSWSLRPVHVLLSTFNPDLILILSKFYSDKIRIKSGLNLGKVSFYKIWIKLG